MSHLCATCTSCLSSSACVGAAIAFLDKQVDNPLMQRERQRIVLVRRGLASSPDENEVREGSPNPSGRCLELSEAQKSIVASLPAQVATMAKKLFAQGWFEHARLEMLAGRNPGRNDWQRALCDGLIAGGIARSDLQLRYQMTLGMTPGSAKVRVSKAVSLFVAGGLVVELDGRLQLRRN